MELTKSKYALYIIYGLSFENSKLIRTIVTLMHTHQSLSSGTPNYTSGILKNMVGRILGQELFLLLLLLIIFLYN